MVRIETLKVNQTIVYDEEGSTFFSYDTPICTIHSDNSVTLYPDWEYSKTTSKYRSEFLGESTKETTKKLAEGTYRLGCAYGECK